MRIIESIEKRLDFETEEITEIVRYKIYTKQLIDPWKELVGIEYNEDAPGTDVFDRRSITYGFYELKDALEYAAKELQRWKEYIDEKNSWDNEQERIEKLKKKYKKALKPSNKVIRKLTIMDVLKQ